MKTDCQYSIDVKVKSDVLRFDVGYQGGNIVVATRQGNEVTKSDFLDHVEKLARDLLHEVADAR